MKNKTKNIAIICNLDSYANSIRPLEIKKYLEKLGHKVTIIDNINIYNENKYSNSKQLSGIGKYVFNFIDNNLKGWPYYFYYLWKVSNKANAVNEIVNKNNFDLLIIENNVHAYLLRKELKCKTILDLDAPYTDELYFTGKIKNSQRIKLNNIYRQIYQKADYLNFQWFRYTDYVKENIYNGNNIIEINYGCHPKSKTRLAKFNKKAKVICLGYLGGKWVNLPLLSKLSKIYPIDVYGGPEPDKKWGLNYKGYATSLDILSNYQFGLITITDDKLRQSSFSSKHIEYLSYGLPVLTPVWRQDKILKDVSIYYDNANFSSLIKKFSNKEKWNEISKRSYEKAKQLEWNIVLEPFGNIIKNI